MFGGPSIPERFLWWKHQMDGRYVWQRRFALLPRRSMRSDTMIWLQWAWQGQRIITGPGEPVVMIQWLTDKEFTWEQLRSKNGT